MTDDVLICSDAVPETVDGSPRNFQLEWWTEAVLKLTRAIMAEHAYDRMPILADALQEAGCDDQVLLRHCRECGQHNSDCWVLFVLCLPGLNTPSLDKLMEIKRHLATHQENLSESEDEQVQLNHATSPRENTASSPYTVWAIYFSILFLTVAVLSAIKYGFIRL